MARNLRTTTIGADLHAAVCPVPRDGIGVVEAVTLTVRGRMDARRNREVPDATATHSLHRLQAWHRRQETVAVQQIDHALSAVDRDVVRLRAVLERPAARPEPVPTSVELAALADAERAAWATRVRAARADHDRAASEATVRAHAEEQLAVLLSVREALRVEGEDVRRQWREAHEMRAARYTRARFGARGRRMGLVPTVAPYEPTAAPTVARG